MSSYMELAGGLANQLFQWAAVLDVFEDGGDHDVAFDTRRVLRPGQRGIPLIDLGLAPRTFDGSAFTRAAWSALGRTVPMMAVKLAPHVGSIPPQPHLTVVTDHMEARRARERGESLWMRGYFQDPRTLSRMRTRLGADLRLAIHERVKADTSPASIAIHVRRGDYISVPRNRELLGVCSEEYYIAAARLLHSPGDEIAILSDDPEWCRGRLLPALPQGARVIDDPSPLSTLKRLIGAKKVVLSNSSFSWWGAFAGAKRPTVAPDPWFDDAQAGGEHMVLPEWAKLDKRDGLVRLIGDQW